MTALIRPNLMALSMRWYAGRGFPEYADTSLSVKTSTTSHSRSEARTRQSFSWRATPASWPVRSCEILRYSPAWILTCPSLAWTRRECIKDETLSLCRWGDVVALDVPERHVRVGILGLL